VRGVGDNQAFVDGVRLYHRGRAHDVGSDATRQGQG
jgi:hypothetical protein